jgi:hypothetical protein
MAKRYYSKSHVFWYFIWDPKEEVSVENNSETIEGYFGIEYHWGTKNKDTVKGICELYERMLKHSLTTGSAWGISVYAADRYAADSYAFDDPIAILGNVETGFTKEYLAERKLPAQEYFDKEFEKYSKRKVKR